MIRRDNSSSTFARAMLQPYDKGDGRMAKNLNAVRKKLNARLAELSNEAKGIDAELREPESPDAEERAIELESHEVLERRGEAALKEIAEIEAALTRIDLGTYGVCASCGEEISDARLEAVPYATRCTDCLGE
jgi:RNA polymerase-binding protein DksA